VPILHRHEFDGPAVKNHAQPAPQADVRERARRCTIKIFTMSGTWSTHQGSNSRDNGIVQWDLLTKENLEIAAGVLYLSPIKTTRKSR
jgi:hypothetical protein